jgi:hypothetical protein
LPPQELHAMGFSMITYPTTLLFQIAKTTWDTLEHLKAGKPMPHETSFNFEEFEKIVEKKK